MSESARLSALIGLLYDATLDPAQWPMAVDGVRDWVGGCCANLVWQDGASASSPVAHAAGGDPDFWKLYFESYAAMNPIYPAAHFVEAGAGVSVFDLVPKHEFLRTRVYDEWMRPPGLVDAVGINLERSALATSLYMVVMRDAHYGAVDCETRRRTALIGPHLRRAALIGRIVKQCADQTGALSEAFDVMDAGVFMINALGRMAFINAFGKALLRDGRVVCEARGALVATAPEAQRALREAIAAANRGDGAIGARGSAVKLSNGENGLWLAHVLPLTSGGRREAGMTYSATAAVFVRRGGLDAPSGLERLTKHYGLTASEVRVLLGIVELGGVPAVAEALGVARSTAKSHLASLFAKTGARRQADLVKLVAAHGVI